MKYRIFPRADAVAATEPHDVFLTTRSHTLRRTTSAAANTLDGAADSRTETLEQQPQDTVFEFAWTSHMFENMRLLR